MADSVADMESSAMSLNRHSWAEKERDPAPPKDNTPLLRKHRVNGASSASAAGHGGPQAVGQESSASYPDNSKQGLYVKKTVFGEVRSCQRLTWVEWLFIVLATITMAGIAGMSAERFVFIHNSFGNFTPDFNTSSGDGSGSGDSHTDCLHWSCLNDFTFAVLALVNWLFCIYYCYDGLLRERPFEIIGYAFTIFIILTYVVINFIVEGEEGDFIKLIRLVVSVILGPLNIVLSLVVQHRMGYLVFNLIGSNTDLTRAYHTRSLFLTVQKFNLQILTNILVLSWVKDGHFTSLGEKIVLPLLIVYMVIIAYVGWAAVIWEIRPLAMIWIFLASLSFGYYIFKILNVAVHWSYYREVYTEYYSRGGESARTHFLYIAIIILFACVLGMIAGVAITILMLVVMGNFGKGLKDRVPPPCCKGDSYDVLSEAG